MPKPLPRPVKALGLVSLLNDVSSEMIYPLLPAFLTRTLQAGPAALGVIEGLAEAAASLVKIVSGWLSDRFSRRKPLVVAGYALSSLVRPLVAVAATAGQVLAIRLADRIGKGTRGAPRDALLADVTPAGQRGRAYGFHRAMDHTGALVGPLLASALLLLSDDLRLVFALALVPGLLAVAVLVFGVREAPRTEPEPSAATADRPRADAPGSPATARAGPLVRGGDADSTASAAPPLPPAFRRYLAVLALFTLGNSSDAFLLLRAQEAGVALAAVPLLWSFHHLVKALVSTPAGSLSDRLGRRPAIALGFAVYALAYAGFALARTPLLVAALFALYGLHHALSEGPERALVADLAGSARRGRAFGLYHAVTGVMLLPASLLTGGLWQAFGAGVALGTGAALAATAAILLFAAVPEPGTT
jgi:MFS family permease